MAAEATGVRPPLLHALTEDGLPRSRSFLGAAGRCLVDSAPRSGDLVATFVRHPSALGGLADKVTVAIVNTTPHHTAPRPEAWWPFASHA